MTDTDFQSSLNTLFEGKQVVAGSDGSRNAVLPLTDFHPPLSPHDVDVVVAAIDSIVGSGWSGVNAVVGLADRSSGPLTHGVALRRNLPYSLANWYPAGSQGDIVVENSGGFTGQSGVVFFNGLKKGDRVIFVDDVIRRGKSSSTLLTALQKAGIIVEHAFFVGEVSGRGGIEHLNKLGFKTTALCTIDCSGAKTTIVKSVKVPKLPAIPVAPTIDEIKRRTSVEMQVRFQNVLNAFVGIKVYRATGSDYPYCNFPLTDFTPLLQPSLVEDMADCMVWLGSFHDSNIIVSESDRGGGPLTLAMSRRLNLKFTMANWSQSPHTVGVAAAASVGYSGHGKLFLNGLKKGNRCLVVDDMLSSGGTAEGLFLCIEAAGATVAEAHFASEKVTTGGRGRLGNRWPNLPLISLCFFDAGKSTTIAANPIFGSNETPIQKISEFDSTVGTFGKYLHKALVLGIVYLYITQR